jgi:hypothetical protein
MSVQIAARSPLGLVGFSFTLIVRPFSHLFKAFLNPVRTIARRSEVTVSSLVRDEQKTDFSQGHAILGGKQRPQVSIRWLFKQPGSQHRHIEDRIVALVAPHSPVTLLNRPADGPLGAVVGRIHC